MVKSLKYLGLGLLGIVLLFGTVIGGIMLWVQITWRQTFPEVPQVPIQASKDPKVIARGKYLFHAVVGCPSCHSTREDYQKIGATAPPTGGLLDFGPLGVIRPPNITNDKKTGVSTKYSDAQIARILRYGIRPDHSAVFMKFAVGPMADEDLQAVISYLRTVQGITKKRKPHGFTILGKVLIRFKMPYVLEYKPKFLWKAPPFVKEGKISVERGRYLADGPAGCFACHLTFRMSEKKKVEIVAPYGGYAEADPDPTQPGMEIAAPNLTPDPKTGHIYKWTEDQFVKRFRKGRVYKGSFMPWEALKEMTEKDLRSIYRYLKTLKPYKHDVPTYRKKGWKPGKPIH